MSEIDKSAPDKIGEGLKALEEQRAAFASKTKAFVAEKHKKAGGKKKPSKEIG